MASTLANPYAGCGTGTGAWVRGNLHGHSKEHSGCSSIPLAEGIALYHAAGAGFVAVTDHDHVTDLGGLRARYPDMVFLEGFEHSAAENVLFVGERVRSPLLHRLPLAEALASADGLLTVVCHPRPRANDDYWTVEKILALSPQPAGIEVYNGHYAGASGNRANPLYTDTWDRLLTHGARMWGYANDDFHDPPDFGRAWNMAWVDSLTPAGVVRALASGRCYGTTGLLAESITVHGPRVAVRLAGPAEGRFIGPEGRVLSRSTGRDFAWRHGGEAYLRFEAEGAAGTLWLQPLYPTAP